MTLKPIVISGKTRQCFERNGVLFTRVCFDIRVTTYDTFLKRLKPMGEKTGYAINKLIEGFNRSTGLGEQVKSAGDMYEFRLSEHIQEAVKRAMADLNGVQLWSKN